MKATRLFTLSAAAILVLAGTPLHAQPEAAASLGERLAGSSFKGIYVRAGTQYSMEFGRDGNLSDSAGRSGRWWVDDQGLYCREWADGPMAGVETCMEVIFHLGRVAIYSGDDKVLEGEIVPATE